MNAPPNIIPDSPGLVAALSGPPLAGQEIELLGSSTRDGDLTTTTRHLKILDEERHTADTPVLLGQDGL